eukprot:jgi/Orpsp1_1/1175466/evm.model.c7180000054005.2
MTYFNMLIGLKTTADNCLFIHPLLKSLCMFTIIENFDVFAHILDEQDSEKIACFIKFTENKSINFLNNIEDNENMINFKVDLLAHYIDIIAISSDDLIQSKLNPHYIKLIENAKPFK